MLKTEEMREIDEELAIVPRKRAACIEALKVVQRHRGYVSDEAVKEVADYLDMSPGDVDGVATFYNLIFRKPVGRHVILVCDSVSCWVMGYDILKATLMKHLEIAFGETTSDNRFTLLTIPCLGCCDRAPAMMVDDDLYGPLEPESVEKRVREILEQYS